MFFVVDSTINVRDPRQVVMVLSSQDDPQRDLFIAKNTPFDTLDFVSAHINFGGRLTIDAKK